MASPGLPLLLLLLAAPPLQPSWLPPPDTPEGKATITGFILSALDRATSFLKKRLPEINLDGVVGFRMLEGGCTLVGLDWPLRRQFSARHLPALHPGTSPPSGPQIRCSDCKKRGAEGGWPLLGRLETLCDQLIFFLEAGRIQRPLKKRFGNYYFPGRNDSFDSPSLLTCQGFPMAQ